MVRRAARATREAGITVVPFVRLCGSRDDHLPPAVAQRIAWGNAAGLFGLQ